MVWSSGESRARAPALGRTAALRLGGVPCSERPARGTCGPTDLMDGRTDRSWAACEEGALRGMDRCQAVRGFLASPGFSCEGSGGGMERLSGRVRGGGPGFGGLGLPRRHLCSLASLWADLRRAGPPGRCRETRIRTAVRPGSWGSRTRNWRPRGRLVWLDFGDLGSPRQARACRISGRQHERILDSGFGRVPTLDSVTSACGRAC